MPNTHYERLVGADSITVESIIITLLSSVIFGFSASWKYYLIFQLSLIAVILMMLFRVMANKAEDPNLNIIKNSLRWSSKLLQIALIGTIATLSIQITNYVEFLLPVALFTAIACTLSLSFALVDQLLLGEYAETWVDIIFEETEDDIIGMTIRSTANFGRRMIESVVNNEPVSRPQSTVKGILLGIGLLSLLFLVTLPISLILAGFFGQLGIAFLVILSVIFLRDMTRYIYINYGAAQSFSDLEWSLKWELTWTVVMGVLLAGILGYDLTSIP